MADNVSAACWLKTGSTPAPNPTTNVLMPALKRLVMAVIASETARLFVVFKEPLALNVAVTPYPVAAALPRGGQDLELTSRVGRPSDIRITYFVEAQLEPQELSPDE